MFPKLRSALDNLERFKLKELCTFEYYKKNYGDFALAKVATCKNMWNYTYQKCVQLNLKFSYFNTYLRLWDQNLWNKDYQGMCQKKRLNERKKPVWFSKYHLWNFSSSIRSTIKEVESLEKNITDFELLLNISVASWTASTTVTAFYI